MAKQRNQGASGKRSTSRKQQKKDRKKGRASTRRSGRVAISSNNEKNKGSGSSNKRKRQGRAEESEPVSKKQRKKPERGRALSTSKKNKSGKKSNAAPSKSKNTTLAKLSEASKTSRSKKKQDPKVGKLEKSSGSKTKRKKKPKKKKKKKKKRSTSAVAHEFDRYDHPLVHYAESKEDESYRSFAQWQHGLPDDTITPKDTSVNSKVFPQAGLPRKPETGWTAKEFTKLILKEQAGKGLDVDYSFLDSVDIETIRGSFPSDAVLRLASFKSSEGIGSRDADAADCILVGTCNGWSFLISKEDYETPHKDFTEALSEMPDQYKTKVILIGSSARFTLASAPQEYYLHQFLDVCSKASIDQLVLQGKNQKARVGLLAKTFARLESSISARREVLDIGYELPSQEFRRKVLKLNDPLEQSQQACLFRMESNAGGKVPYTNPTFCFHQFDHQRLFGYLKVPMSEVLATAAEAFPEHKEFFHVLLRRKGRFDDDLEFAESAVKLVKLIVYGTSDHAVLQLGSALRMLEKKSGFSFRDLKLFLHQVISVLATQRCKIISDLLKNKKTTTKDRVLEVLQSLKDPEVELDEQRLPQDNSGDFLADVVSCIKLKGRNCSVESGISNYLSLKRAFFGVRIEARFENMNLAHSVQVMHTFIVPLLSTMFTSGRISMMDGSHLSIHMFFFGAEVLTGLAFLIDPSSSTENASSAPTEEQVEQKEEQYEDNTTFSKTKKKPLVSYRRARCGGLLQFLVTLASSLGRHVHKGQGLLLPETLSLDHFTNMYVTIPKTYKEALLRTINSTSHGDSTTWKILLDGLEHFIQKAEEYQETSKVNAKNEIEAMKCARTCFTYAKLIKELYESNS